MGQRLDAARHARFAGLRVRLRPDAPRHPPRTLDCRVELCPTVGSVGKMQVIGCLRTAEHPQPLKRGKQEQDLFELVSG